MDSKRVRTGGRRRDRVFKIHIDVPFGTTDKLVMELIERTVIERIETARAEEPAHLAAKLDPASVKVLRNSPVYAEMQ